MITGVVNQITSDNYTDIRNDYARRNAKFAPVADGFQTGTFYLITRENPSTVYTVTGMGVSPIFSAGLTDSISGMYAMVPPSSTQ